MTSMFDWADVTQPDATDLDVGFFWLMYLYLQECEKHPSQRQQWPSETDDDHRYRCHIAQPPVYFAWWRDLVQDKYAWSLQKCKAVMRQLVNAQRVAIWGVYGIRPDDGWRLPK